MNSENITQSVIQSVLPAEVTEGSEENCWIVAIVSVLVLVGLYKLFRLILKMISPSSWIPYDLHKRYVPESSKSWALVTGSSQGIGLGFAQQLAKRGFNIILMSRSQSKLKQAVEQVKKVNSQVQIKYFPVDFEKLRTAQDYEQLLQKVKQLDISLLVNNVGVYNPRDFLDSQYNEIKKQMIVNLLPVTCLTRLFLPRMLERGNQLGKRSGIINVASAAAQSLLKGSSHYCATKAFDDLFTRSLQVQYRTAPIDFLSLRPYLVTSPMARNQKTFLHVSANQCANGALNDLGKQSVSYGHFFHRMQGVLVDQLNGKIFNWILCQINKDLIRKYKQLDEKSK